MPTRSIERIHPSRLLPLLVAVVLGTGGCVQTAMLPAEQQDAGTTVASFSVDEPGVLFLPRLSAQVTRGLGGGDLTANLSGVPTGKWSIVGGGLTGRYYLTHDLNAALQFQMTSFSGATAGLALFGLQTAPTDPPAWYYGGQVGGITGAGPGAYLDHGDSSPGAGAVPVVGGTLGYGPVDVGTSTRMQLELELNVPVWGDEEEVAMPGSGLSIGVFGLFD
jgi:hypothetical protein